MCTRNRYLWYTGRRPGTEDRGQKTVENEPRTVIRGQITVVRCPQQASNARKQATARCGEEGHPTRQWRAGLEVTPCRLRRGQ